MTFVILYLILDSLTSFEPRTVINKCNVWLLKWMNSRWSSFLQIWKRVRFLFINKLWYQTQIFSFMNFCDRIFLLGFRKISCGTYDIPKSLAWFKILISAVGNFGSSFIQDNMRVLFQFHIKIFYIFIVDLPVDPKIL